MSVVRHIKTTSTDSITIRRFSVLMSHGTAGSRVSEEREVVQIHFTDWPDFGVPTDPSGIERVLDLMDLYSACAPRSPIIIHCSAGMYLLFV